MLKGPPPWASNTVMVFGAGMTKAFLPKAPTMIDDYDVGGYLTKKYESHGTAAHLLKLEKEREQGNINLERLMTRLDSGMPYDGLTAPRAQTDSLLHDLHQSFFKKLGFAVSEQYAQELVAFAQHCVRSSIHCITFNYDDVFDWALTKVPADGERHWRLSHGYGFEMSPAGGSFFPVLEDPPSMLLIKLHGSVNWRKRLGHTAPVNPGDIICHQDWDKGDSFWKGPAFPDELSDPDPFIVPPILIKNSITRDPLLQLLWIKAFKRLLQATRVVFVGYSMPDTDIASTFLFREGIGIGARVDVVVLPRNDNEKNRIEGTFSDVLGKKRLEFHFGDARPWLAQFIKDWTPETLGPGS